MSTPSIVAGAKGFVLTLDPLAGHPGNITSLSGATVSLVFRQPDGHTKITRTATVAVDGLTASYITDGTEIPVGGQYELQMDVVNGGTALPSFVADLIVAPRL